MSTMANNIFLSGYKGPKRSQSVDVRRIISCIQFSYIIRISGWDFIISYVTMNANSQSMARL